MNPAAPVTKDFGIGEYENIRFQRSQNLFHFYRVVILALVKSPRIS